MTTKIEWADATINPVVGCTHCSPGKYLFLAGNGNPNWKGGRTIASNGYVLIRCPEHPNADRRGYIYEHRMVASQKLGRPLKTSEIVHHIDGNKLNNSPENLSVEESIAAHQYRHRTSQKNLRLPGEENPIIECACGCGKTFCKYDGTGRPRRFISGHNLHGRTKHGVQYKN